MQTSRMAAFGNVLVVILPITWGVYLGALRSFASVPIEQKINLGVMYLGLALLIYAKWPQLKELDFWTFGVKGESPRRKFIYLVSYGLMLIGVVFSIHYKMSYG